VTGNQDLNVIKINVLSRDGKRFLIEAEEDSVLMQALRNNGGDELVALCGGQMSCATCHVYIDLAFADRLPPMSENEDDLLNCSDYRKTESRLSCQVPCIAALDGVNVEIAPEN
jgi:2Fe-2S ferredoxin